MATPPDFSVGQVLTAAHMNAVGLWLVKTQTIGANVPDVTVTDAFSADFDNYLVTYTGGTSSTGANLYLEIGNAVSAYHSSLQYAALGGASSLATGQTNAAFFNWAGNISTNRVVCQIDILGPFLAKYTNVKAWFDNDTDVGLMQGVLRNSNSYTSFKLYPSTGTLTGGTICVYGYRK